MYPGASSAMVFGAGGALEVRRAPGSCMVDTKVIEGRGAREPGVTERRVDGCAGGETTALDVVEGKVGVSGQTGADLYHIADCAVSLRFRVINMHGSKVIHAFPVGGLRDGGGKSLGPGEHKQSKPVGGSGAPWGEP